RRALRIGGVTLSGNLMRGPLATSGLSHSEHDPEKACPALDAGWVPVFGKDHAQTTTRAEWIRTKVDRSRNADHRERHVAGAPESRASARCGVKIACCKNGKELKSLLLKILGRSFQTIHDGDDLLHARPTLANGTHCLQDRTAFGCHVFEEND